MSSRSQASEAGRPNSLGINDRALAELLEEFEQQSGSGGSADRAHVRRAFALQTVHVKFKQPGGSTTLLRLACRNISRGGISLLHRSFVNPGTQVAMVLIHLEKGATVHEGEVVRCEHRGSMLHEVGVRFRQPINIRDYMRLDPFADCYNLENVNPESLVGCMVHLEDSDLDRRIIQHFMRGTLVRIRPAGSVGEAMELVRDGCDLVLADYHLGADETGADLVRAMRAEGNRTPVILTSCDTTETTKAMMLASHADAFLSKPIEQSLLHRAIGEFLIARRDEVGSGRAGEESGVPRALMKEYGAQLLRFADELTVGADAQDFDACGKIAMKIRGSAPALGFTNIGDLAEASIRMIGEGKSVTQILEPIRTLIAACRAAQPD